MATVFRRGDGNSAVAVGSVRQEGIRESAAWWAEPSRPPQYYLFVSERGGPISPIGFHPLLQRVREATKMPFPIHPHLLGHACGFKLANDGHDTRALQHYLGHKNIQHTVRYTEMAPNRFKDFWRG